jgi:predicted  nucleic acid-binding Zn-ribbon protein
MEVKLSLPLTYTLPAFYATAEPKVIALALSLGAEAYETLEGRAVALARSETNAEAVAKVTAEFKEEIETLQAEFRARLKTLTQEKAKAEETNSTIQASLAILEAQQSTGRAQIQRETKESYQELLQSKEQQITALQRTLEQHIEGMSGKVELLQNSITRTFASSKEKGSYGENFMEGMLKKAFDCDIEVVSKEAQSADIRMVRAPQLEYFWEIKNYTRMITNKEIEKFRRDMRLHPEVCGGFLVSLRTGITGRNRGGDIDIEFLEDGRFIVYISTLMAREDIVFYLQTLRPLLQVIEALRRPAKTDSDVIRVLESKSAIITNLLRSHSVSIAKHKNSLVSHKKRCDQMFAEFQAYLMESDTQVQNVLRIAIGAEEESDELQRDSETYLPALVFSKERLSDLEGRSKAFVGWLLGIVEIREGSDIRVKDLIDKAREKGFSEKFVRDSREEIFQPTAWASRSPLIAGLVWKI